MLRGLVRCEWRIHIGVVNAVLSQIAAERLQPLAEHFTPFARNISVCYRAVDVDGLRPHVDHNPGSR
jgi:hypothetical protein